MGKKPLVEYKLPHRCCRISCTAAAEPPYGWWKDGNYFFAERSSNLSIFEQKFICQEGLGPTVVDSLLLKIASTPSNALLFRSEMNSALVPFLYSYGFLNVGGRFQGREREAKVPLESLLVRVPAI
jgi:hypothetical protein